MRSSSPARALSMRIGIADSLRTAEQTSSPERSGSMRSSTIRAGRMSRAMASPSRPLMAVSTWKPSRSRYPRATSWTDGSSSITRTRSVTERSSATGGLRPRRKLRSRVARSRNLSGQFVQFPQDRDGLGLQLALGRLMIGGRHLAQLEVELGVADLAVLGLLGRLELRAAVLGLRGRGGGRAERRRHDERDERHQRDEGEDQFGVHAGCLASSGRTRLGAAARSGRTRGGRLRAIRAPAISSRPPIQIQATNGKTITRKTAAGARCSYICPRARMSVAWVWASALPNFLSAIATGFCRIDRSGWIAAQVSLARPHFRPTSLVDSPSKKRWNGPAAGSRFG